MALLDRIKDGLTTVIPASKRRDTIPPPQGIGNVGVGHANFEDDVRPLCFSPPTHEASSEHYIILLYCLLRLHEPHERPAHISCSPTLGLGVLAMGGCKPRISTHFLCVVAPS